MSKIMSASIENRGLSEYEQIRARNIARNMEVLRELGLMDPEINPCVRKKSSVIIEKKKIVKTPKKKVQPIGVVNNNEHLTQNETENVEQPMDQGVRRSSRLLGKRVAVDYTMIEEIDTTLRSNQNRTTTSQFINPRKLNPETYRYKKPTTKIRPNVFGPIAGVPIGTHFQSRIECNYSGVHRPTVAGIHGSEDGAYSVVLSGGYEDDVDKGDMFTYTGEGGRDLKGTKLNPKNLRTAPQSKDQTLSNGNFALNQSIKNRNPVRVVRGFGLKNAYAPNTGYRYDGLYNVERCWMSTGQSGFRVFHFAFKRCPNQDPAPWEQNNNNEQDEEEIENMKIKQEIEDE